MTDLRQRAERIAKKYGLTVFNINRQEHKATSAVREALEEMAAEVRREAIEECMTVLYERDDVGQPIIEAIRALLPAAQKEETP